MVKSEKAEIITQEDFGPETLLIFVGHSSDTNAEIKVLKNMEGDLQNELEAFLKAAPHSFKRLKIWEWNYDAPRKVGGQEGVISPYLHSASIALFLFKERVGKVTWDELAECRERKENPIPILVLFPTFPDAAKLGDVNAAKAWMEVLEKKAELTEDWGKTDSTSITPIKTYANNDELKEIAFDEVKRSFPEVLRKTQIYPPFDPIKKEPERFLGESTEFSFDRKPVMAYTWDQLDQDQIKDFLSKQLSRDEAERAGNVSPSVLEHLKILGLLWEPHPFLGTFLCFASREMITSSFDSSGLHLVRYHGTVRGQSKAETTKIRENLLHLLDKGLTWLRSQAGLKRLGTVGTSQRDDLEIPEIALREALANALVHRKYEGPECRDQPTRIEVFEDRVVITSYGGLPPDVSLDDLNNNPENIVPFRRNPIIATIFNNMTHIEANASGVSRMRLETQKVLLPVPKIDAGENFVRVTFVRRSKEAIESTIKREELKPFVPLDKGPVSVFISSTARDLPSHRNEIMEASLRQGMFPVMMEHVPASDEEAINLSLGMVDQADIYIGVFANRYGHVPEKNNKNKISLAEMEYNRAVERGIPRLIFVIHHEHPVKFEDVEMGEGADKLKTFLERVKKENIVKFYRSPNDLRAEAINSLSVFRKPDVTTFHFISDIPKPPQAYIAHPYTLLQTHDLIGRRKEFDLLTKWLAKTDSKVHKTPVLSIVAIGGMGKSALTWKWFNNISPEEMKPLAGRMWWSFYESDASFENFVIRALAYVTGQSITEVRQIPTPDREAQLLAILDRESYLIVLDGLERLLLAYARMDANRLGDSDVGDQKNIRKAADPRVGQFLKRLTVLRESRVLINTRLQPSELENYEGSPAPGVFRHNLEGLADEDALDLWRQFGVNGSREFIIPILNSFGNHPLLIQALASEIANYRPAPGDFEKWREANPQFDPTTTLERQDSMSHVLEMALRGLNQKVIQVLQVIAAFRMPAQYDTLTAVLIGEKKNQLRSEEELDQVLRDLEDRGLIGWDKRANRYDMHPIVRGVIWNNIGERGKHDVYSSLHTHFEAVPMIDDFLKVNSLEDLSPAIELYNTLIGMGLYNEAIDLFSKRLDKATLYRLSAGLQRVQLLEMLFPDGLDQLPSLKNRNDQAIAIQGLAQGYKFIGLAGRAAILLRRAIQIESELGNDKNLAIALTNLADTLRRTGALFESDETGRRALIIARKLSNVIQEVTCLQLLGSTLAARGNRKVSESALLRAVRIAQLLNNRQLEGLNNTYLAARALWLGDNDMAQIFADRAWELASTLRYEGDFILAARLQGKAALGQNNLTIANEKLHHALARARAISLVEEELPALSALAELRRRQGDERGAREFLNDLWEYAERGGYTIVHADALNVLAQIERDAGNTDKAIEAATRAYELAWCDGPPYAYHWGLIKAQKHLEEIGAPLPDMPPFDESKYEPMPEVEIDPDDEFHVGNKESPQKGSKRRKKND